MTGLDIRQAKRNALLLALIDYCVEIESGVAPALLPDGRYPIYRREDVRKLRETSREWFALQDRLASGYVPADDREDAAHRLAELLVEIEGHWPAARVLRQEYMDAEFTPTYIDG